VLTPGWRMRLVRMGAAVAVAAALAWPGGLELAGQVFHAARALLPAVSPDPDLTLALTAGGRTITLPRPPRPFAWAELARMQSGNDTLVVDPVSACWRGGILTVAESRSQRLLSFTSDGRLVSRMGGRGTGAGRFGSLSVVRCGPRGTPLLAGDDDRWWLTLLDSAGGVLRSFRAPPTPQISLYLGDYAIGRGGRIFDSWLGSTRSAGPYLTATEWSGQPLVRRSDATGRMEGAFGVPVAYSGTVARRVLNRTALALHRDTVWVLTQGDATVRGFDARSGAAGPVMRLPVYYRGREPFALVEGGAGAGAGWRANQLIYHPNVQGLAVVDDSLFATIRYRDWRLALRGAQGRRWVDYFASSAVEVMDRGGRVVAALDVRGKAVSLASDGGSRLAVLSEEQDGSRRLWVSDHLAAALRKPPTETRCTVACRASDLWGVR
jgi:hypothetical protein